MSPVAHIDGFSLRERIHEEVRQRGFHPGVQAFTQSYGAEALDAGILLIPHVGFLPATPGPRVQSTVRIEQTLLTSLMTTPSLAACRRRKSCSSGTCRYATR